jgi:hypothetical protein
VVCVLEINILDFIHFMSELLWKPVFVHSLLILLFKAVYNKSLVRLQVARFVWLVSSFKFSFLNFYFYGISTVVMLRKIFGPMREEAAEGWRKLCTEKLQYLYTSPSIIRMIGSRRWIWSGHVASHYMYAVIVYVLHLSSFHIKLLHDLVSFAESTNARNFTST